MDINRFLDPKIHKDEGESVKELPLRDIVANPFQPRQVFDPNQLEELASSIKEYGVLQPVIVRRVGDRYELISGERRFRASKLAGKDSIPALIRPMEDKEVAELALIENLQREDLNYFEEAEGYQRLILDFQLTQEEVARKMGKSQPTVANKLRLLQLDSSIRQEISSDVITERHVRALLKLKDTALQKTALDKIYQGNLNVKQTEQLVERLLQDVEQEKKVQRRRRMTQAVKNMQLMVNTIESTVNAIRESGLDATMAQQEYDDYVEVTIRLPKQ